MKRPRTKDPRHLSSWLNEVLTVSDFETPLEQAEPAETKPAKSEPSAPSEKTKSSKESEEGTKKKEKKSGDKKEKKRKLGSKSPEAGAPPSKAKKDETSAKKSEKKPSEGSEKKKKNGSKDSPLKKESEDGFVGSFADWRDRKKEKALNKKGPGSLRK